MLKLSNSGLNPERTRSILNAWEQGKPILPPRLYFDGDKLFIEDGNHRLFAACSLEEVYGSIELSFPQISTLEKVKLLEEFKFIV